MSGVPSDQDIQKKSNELYDETAIASPHTSTAVKWSNPETQYIRFKELIQYVDLHAPDASVLDVGCGNGELFKFLSDLGFRGSYLGIDINQALLRQAQERFPNINIKRLDLLQERLEKKFDYVLMSGLFNLNCGQSLDWVRRFISVMFDHACDRLVFNAISTHVNHRDAQMFYLDPAETLEFCIKNLSPRVSISHHNLPFNYTVCVYRKK